MVRIIAYFILIFSSLHVFAETITAPENRDVKNIGSYLTYLEDPEHRDIAFAMEEFSKGAFNKHADDSINFSFVKSTYWFSAEISLPEHLSPPQTIYFQAKYALLDYVSLYVVSDGVVIEEYQSGDMLPFSKREILYHDIVFPITIPSKKPVRIFMSVKTSGTIEMEPLLSGHDAFFNRSGFMLLIYGLFYGAMLIIIFYCLSVFIITRDLGYLLYVFFTSIVAFYQFTLDGLTYRYFFGEVPEFGSHFIPVLIIFANIFTALLCRHFLNTKKNYVKADKIILYYLSAAVVLLFASFFMHYTTASRLATLLTFPGAFITVVVSMMALKDGYRAARFYMTGWLVFLFGTVVLALLKFDLFPKCYFSENAQRYGTLMLVVLLALSLGDRISLLEYEKSDIQQKSNKKLRKSNRKLKAANEELEVAHKKLSRLNRAKSDFLSLISHELKTPINGILSGVDLLEDTSNTEEQKELVRIVKESITRLEQFSNTALFITQIKASRAKMFYDPVSVKRLIQSALLEAAKIHPDIINRTTISFDKEDMRIEANEELTRKGLIAVLDNAAKYNQSEDKKIIINFNFEEFRPCICICDNGVGFSEEMIQDAKELFTAGNIINHAEGFGLGLYVTGLIMEAQDGKMLISNNPDCGAQVKLIFRQPFSGTLT